MAKKVTFERSMAQLEAVVGQLESGQLELTEVIKLYEEGMKLSKACQKMLDEGQKKLTALREENGTITEEEMFEEDE
ncbi:MAG: exodeoxyribonuclease VII small subunit [Eubacteriales bacterium]|nr:exodeoxyribonuclease VII small subunit [Eubacteriales bacterium]